MAAVAVGALAAVLVARPRNPGPPPPPAATAVAGSASPAPAFAGVLVGGGRLDSRSLAGRAVVLAFWSSSCLPCRHELRELEGAWRAAPPGVGVVGVDVADKAPAALAVLRRAGISYPNVADTSGAIARAYGVEGTPTLVAVDRRRMVLRRLLGLASPAQISTLMRSLVTRSGPGGR